MTLIQAKACRPLSRGFVLLRSSVAAGVAALAIGAGALLIGPVDMTTGLPPSIDDGPLEVQSWNAAALAASNTAAPAAATAAVPAYAGPPVQSWEEIEAQFKPARTDKSVLADPLATP